MTKIISSLEELAESGISWHFIGVCCTLTPNSSQQEKTMNLVFASGVLVPQHILGVDYFRGIKAHVEANGHHAVFPQVFLSAPNRMICAAFFIQSLSARSNKWA
jgi:hypothetical protein